MGLLPKAFRCSNCYQMGCEKQHRQVVRTTTVDFNFLVSFSLCLTYCPGNRRMRGAVIFGYGKRNDCRGDILQLYIAGQALGLSVVRLSSGPRCAVTNRKRNITHWHMHFYRYSDQYILMHADMYIGSYPPRCNYCPST